MRRSFIFLAAAVASAVTATRTDALIFGLDDRVFIASDAHSTFGPVGIIFGMPEAGYATAFLVDECHALTVQHAFGAAKTAVGRKAVFAAGVKGSSKNWRISSATVVAEGGLQFDPSPNDAFSQRKADWALLRLDECLGRIFGFAKLSSKLPTEEEEIMVAGYPVDRSLSEGLVVDPSCFIRGTRSGVLLHDCSTMPGNSGSPLFRIVTEHSKNRLEVFAMNTAGHAYGVPGADLVLPVREYLPNYAGVAAPLTAEAIDPN